MKNTGDGLARVLFTGEIAKGEQTFAINFHASAGEDFRLQIEPEPLSTGIVWQLHSAIGEPGSYSAELTLRGKAADGAEFFSDQIAIVGVKMGTGDNTIKLSARTATVTLLQPQYTPTPKTRLWLRGFKSHRNPVVQTEMGRLTVRGASKRVGKDDVSGSITLEADPADVHETWPGKADAFLTFLHQGLAFAHGGRLHAPRLDLLINNQWRATFYDGGGFTRGLPVIPRLNQGPFIKTLVTRYEDPRPFPDMLWTAMGWLHNDTTIDETRFLTSMTALEAIVEHLIPDKLTTVVAKVEFAALRDRLLSVVAQSSLPADINDIFAGKIRNLNARSLSQKIEALRDHFGLSQQTYNAASIAGLIKLRNDIVHTGKASHEDKVWPAVVFARELISEIFLHEIGYAGPYESYVNGYRMAHFMSASDSDSSARP